GDGARGGRGAARRGVPTRHGAPRGPDAPLGVGRHMETTGPGGAADMRASTRARPGARARPAVRAEERADRRGVGRCTILAGTSRRGLADAVAREAGVPLGRVEVGRFPDGELTVRIDESVRDRDVFLLQATSSPVNEHLVELLALADACRRGSAGRITAVVPYFGYARSDRRAGRREPIMAGLVAEVLEAAGVDH